MRVFPVLFVIIIGAFFVLARNFTARLFMSLAYQIPGLKKREKTFLQSMAVASVVFGAAFIILGLLMALNIVFPW